MAVDKIKAQKLVATCLAEYGDISAKCVILEDETIEKEWGWVFFFQSKEYLISNDGLDMLAGNAPFLVNRYTGEITQAGTAHPVEYYIGVYEWELSDKAAK